MAKKIMIDMVPIWRDRRLNEELKMKLYSALVGEDAEGWTLTSLQEKDRISAHDVGNADRCLQ